MNVTQGTVKVNGQTAVTADYFEHLGSQGTQEGHTVKAEVIVTSVGQVVQPTAEVSFEARYPSSDVMSRVFGRALKLLREAEDHAERAATLSKEADSLGADDAIYAIKPLLPELFCCRQLGDGFGLVVGGLLSAFQNLSGLPMSMDQMRTVSACLSTLRAQPMIGLDLADRQIESLEAVGLNPDPAGIEELVGAISPDEGTTAE